MDRAVVDRYLRRIGAVRGWSTSASAASAAIRSGWISAVTSRTRTGCSGWSRTSPKSHFTQSLTCSLLTDTGRITLSGRKLIRTSDGEREEQQVLASDAEVLAAYRTHFGITLDRVPLVQP